MLLNRAMTEYTVSVLHVLEDSTLQVLVVRMKTREALT